ncbi:hypothetical protein N0V90_001481 [Kalmusia sp. IMI 367209]|nr:hypothetical protein N0V90_001481 [Kalmusia sp. IMI 367209]
MAGPEPSNFFGGIGDDSSSEDELLYDYFPGGIRSELTRKIFSSPKAPLEISILSYIVNVFADQTSQPPEFKAIFDSYKVSINTAIAYNKGMRADFYDAIIDAVTEVLNPE